MQSKVTDYLEEKRVNFDVIFHPRRYTALETAEAEHVGGYDVAKVVMVKAGGRDTMFVIPANRRLSPLKVGFELGTQDVGIEEERDFASLFPNCEKGAMPPIGPMYGIPCYVDVELVANKDIVFNAGSHEESVKMAMKDYLMLAEAEIGDYSVPR